jgi:hypothetical protein
MPPLSCPCLDSSGPAHAPRLEEPAAAPAPRRCEWVDWFDACSICDFGSDGGFHWPRRSPVLSAHPLPSAPVLWTPVLSALPVLSSPVLSAPVPPTPVSLLSRRLPFVDSRRLPLFGLQFRRLQFCRLLLSTPLLSTPGLSTPALSDLVAPLVLCRLIHLGERVGTSVLDAPLELCRGHRTPSRRCASAAWRAAAPRRASPRRAVASSLSAVSIRRHARAVAGRASVPSWRALPRGRARSSLPRAVADIAFLLLLRIYALCAFLVTRKDAEALSALNQELRPLFVELP